MRAAFPILALVLLLAGCVLQEEDDGRFEADRADGEAVGVAESTESDNGVVPVPAGGDIEPLDAGIPIDHMVLTEEEFSRTYVFDSATERVEALIVANNDGSEIATVRAALTGTLIGPEGEAVQAVDTLRLAPGEEGAMRLILTGELQGQSRPVEASLLMEASEPVRVSGSVFAGR